jgi:hypothetical protein
MKRKLASVNVLTNLQKIEGADTLQKGNILGWSVVTKAGAFSEGEEVVYIEADAVLPEVTEFEFLRKNKFRIKPCRLRGQVSLGLCIPLSEAKQVAANLGNTNVNWSVGEDVTEALGIKKFEPYVSLSLSSDIKGLFPSFIPQTDEMRIQSVPELLNRHENREVYVSEKLEGSSATYYLNDGVFGVCSRTRELKESESNAFWSVAKKNSIEQGLNTLAKFSKNTKNIAIQGELIGPKIQGNHYGLTAPEFRLFNVWDIDKQCPVDYGDLCLASSVLELYLVPIVYHRINLSDKTLEEWVSFANGRSQLADVLREGIVVRAISPVRDEDVGWMSFKAISSEYLLR